MCVGRSGEDLAVKIMLRDYKIRSIAKCPYCGSYMGMTYNKEFMNKLMRFKCNHCGFEHQKKEQGEIFAPFYCKV